MTVGEFDAAAVFADSNHAQVVRRDHFRQPVGDAFVDLDLHHDAVGRKHGECGRLLVQKQAVGLVLKRSVECHPQTDVVVRPDEGLSVILHDADGTEVVLPEVGVDLVEDGFIVGRKDFGVLTLVAEAQGVTIGEDDAALLRDAVHALFDLDEDGRVVCERRVGDVTSDAQFAAKTDAVHFFPVTTEVGRVVVKAGEGVAPVVDAVLVGEQKGSQRLLEQLRLLERDEVFQLKTIEAADGVTEIRHGVSLLLIQGDSKNSCCEETMRNLWNR